MTKFTLPTRRELLTSLAILALWLFVTVAFVGFRSEHILLCAAFLLLFIPYQSSRKLVVALLPFFIFGISYDWMNLLPNYEVNPVDVEGLYTTEKRLFGITVAEGAVLTPNEYFALHHCSAMDFMSGIFYLCWVPLPIIFGIWLYFKGERRAYLHFAIVFLLVNLIGFAFYYIHPAAPPWYVAMHGMEAIPGTPGEVAGLGRFDEMTGLNIFHLLYSRNANVFAALPSLHSAYTLVALIYAIRFKAPRLWIILLAVVTLGIWLTAVYSSHHYIIDVMCGIICALVGSLLFETAVARIAPLRRALDRYISYIS
ncbi:MAG: phosphatase PAP2 family protein [Muribaculaceae bacterium]|nr:phosphatase PAP2 family protein [Bacteroidales bacterium]MDY2734184.1 phosphatase PAP2 family protein [Muribaculaceae bacterium]MDY5387270.1 phosphatase PAP2 family protein [Muribaculaceae bacterium]